jgi:Tfp pilus assembly protein FimT
MNRTSEKTLQAARLRSGEAGFSIEQVVITLAVIAIVSGFAVVGLARSRGTLRLTSATDEITGYLEKARADSVRRHATVNPVAPPDAPAAAQMASITFDSVSSYIVTMDFDNDGMVEADERRTITLPDGVTFPAESITDPAKTVGFNWRGRPTEVVSMGLSNSYGDKTVSISESGSVAIGDTHELEGFDVSDLEAPKDIPKSEFEGAAGEDSSDGSGSGNGNGNGNGKKNDGDTTGGDTTIPGGGTTIPGGDTTTGGGATTTPGNGNGNGGNGNGNGGGITGGTPTLCPCGVKNNGTCKNC